MYRKHILKLVFALSLVLIHFGASAQDGGKFMVDKVVGVVGNSPIYYSEVVEMSDVITQDRKARRYTSDRNTMEEAFENLLLQKLLCNQAQIDSLPANTNYVNNMVEYIIDSLVRDAGSIKMLEDQKGKAIYDIRQSYFDKFLEQNYAVSMENKVKSAVTVTPGEVERFYKRLSSDELPIVPDRYVYAQITKYPLSAKQAKQRVRERLLELRERIINGERFDRLARIYSVDPGSRNQGGELGYMTLEHFLAPFAEALSKLQVGQVSEVVETRYGLHIIQLIDKKGDQYNARHILLRPQYTDAELHETQVLLDSIGNLIKTGSISFEDAALKYSDDKYTRNNGGIANNHEYLEVYAGFNASTAYSMNQFSLEVLYEMSPADFYIVRKLGVGDMSDASLSYDLLGNETYKLIKLLKIIPSHHADLRDDYLDVEQMALDRKQQAHFDEWLDTKIDDTYIRIDDMFRSMNFENPKWLK